MRRQDLALGARITVENAVGRAVALAGDPILRLMHAPWRDRPEETLTSLLTGPPVVRSRLGPVAVASAELCGQVLRDRRFGVRTRAGTTPGGRPGPDGRDPVLEPVDLSFLALDPPDHDRLRRLAQPAFGPTRVRGYRSRAGDLAEQLVADAVARGAFDLVADVAAPLTGTVIAEILGVPRGAVAEFLHWGGVIGETLGGVRSLRAALAAREAEAGLRGLLAGLLDERRDGPGEDLLTQLAGAVDAGEIDSGEAVGMAMLLVLAGFETTTSLLSTAVAGLLDTPGTWAWLGEDPQARAPDVVQEALRFDPPVRFTARSPHVDVELAGEPIAADTAVLLALNAAGRDPAVHTDPHAFDPTRTTASKHLAFGGGAHYCLGAPLALLESEIVLAALASHAPRLARAGAGSRWNSALLGGFRSLPLRASG